MVKVMVGLKVYLLCSQCFAKPTAFSSCVIVTLQEAVEYGFKLKGPRAVL